MTKQEAHERSPMKLVKIKESKKKKEKPNNHFQLFDERRERSMSKQKNDEMRVHKGKTISKKSE